MCNQQSWNDASWGQPGLFIVVNVVNGVVWMEKLQDTGIPADNSGQQAAAAAAPACTDDIMKNYECLPADSEEQGRQDFNFLFVFVFWKYI